MRRFFITGAVIGLLLGGCAESNETAEVDFDFDAANDHFEKIEADFSQLQAEIEGMDISDDISAGIAELEARMNRMEADLERAGRSAGDSWNNVADSMEENLDDLRRDLDDTWNDIKS